LYLKLSIWVTKDKVFNYLTRTIFKSARRHFLQRLLGVLPKRSAKTFLLWFAIALGLSLTISACTNNPVQKQTTSPSSAQNLVVRIAHQKFDPLTLVKAKGNLEERLKPLGVASVKWTEFQSGSPTMEALNAGSIDIARTGDTPPVIAQAADVPLVYVGGSAPKPSSSAVLVRQDSPIKTIADLKGKKVAMAKNSSANYLTLQVIESAGLKWEDIKPVYLSPAEARSAFEQGNVDAWAIWDPFYAVAEAAAKARVLRDSKDLVSNRDFYLANKSFAEQHPDIIIAIRKETQAVATWADKNPAEVAQLLSPMLKIDKPILEKVTKRRDYSFEPMTPEMVTEQQAIADAFYKLKFIPKSIKIQNAVWQSP
jgi:sulfonate transport system substrate-binding protein